MAKVTLVHGADKVEVYLSHDSRLHLPFVRDEFQLCHIKLDGVGVSDVVEYSPTTYAADAEIEISGTPLATGQAVPSGTGQAVPSGTGQAVPSGTGDNAGIVSLDSLLRKLNVIPSDNVIRLVHQRFSPRALLAVYERNAEAALDVYRAAEALPSSTATVRLKKEGWSLDGPLFEGSPITICYRGLNMYVLKPLDALEADRVTAFEPVMGVMNLDDTHHHHHIVKFKLWDAEKTPRIYMVMPKLPTTLEPMHSLAAEHVSQLWSNISSALEFLHSSGFAFLDVKPSNICVTVSKEFVLIDLGSVSRFKAKNIPTTAAYVPRDFEAPHASPEQDWWMLGMTLAEKGCGDKGLDVGSHGTSETKQELIKHLELNLMSKLVFEQWKAKVGL